MMFSTKMPLFFLAKDQGCVCRQNQRPGDRTQPHQPHVARNRNCVRINSGLQLRPTINAQQCRHCLITKWICKTISSNKTVEHKLHNFCVIQFFRIRRDVENCSDYCVSYNTFILKLYGMNGNLVCVKL